VCVRERESVGVSGFCACVCVCVCERERERECVSDSFVCEMEMVCAAC
jgi:hypothetical protein